MLTSIGAMNNSQEIDTSFAKMHKVWTTRCVGMICGYFLRLPATAPLAARPSGSKFNTQLCPDGFVCWKTVECCEVHVSWTDHACPPHQHNFFVDDTLLTLAALGQGAGLAYLPCFMGDSDPSLVRFRPPERQHDLGLWLLYHRDLRRTKRVRLFREFMQAEVSNSAALCEEHQPQ